MVRGFLRDKRLLLRSLGAVGVGSLGVLGYNEYETFSDDFSYTYSSMETDANHSKPRVLPMPKRIKYHIMDFAARYGVPLDNGNERFLHKINSTNAAERNEAITFLSGGTEWIDG